MKTPPVVKVTVIVDNRAIVCKTLNTIAYKNKLECCFVKNDNDIQANGDSLDIKLAKYIYTSHHHEYMRQALGHA